MIAKGYILNFFLIVGITCFYSIQIIYAQASPKNNRLIIKLGYANYLNGVVDAENNRETTPNIRGEVIYSINHLLDAGVYVGYSKGEYVTVYHYPSYGINVNFNILPVFFSNPPTRLDVCLFAKYGGIYGRTPRDFTKKKHYNEYCVGAGAAYFISKHTGLFFDYSLGRFNNHIILLNETFTDKTKARYGVIFKF